MAGRSGFPEFMRKLRTDAKLSVEQAARQIGVGVKDIESWESGKNLPSELSAERIAEVYGIEKAEWLKMRRRSGGT